MFITTEEFLAKLNKISFNDEFIDWKDGDEDREFQPYEIELVD